MSKQMERTIIIILVLILIVVGLSGCASKPKQSKSPNVYDGSLGIMLGCMFDPTDCEKFKKEGNKQKEEAEFQKEFDKIDQERQKTN